MVRARSFLAGLLLLIAATGCDNANEPVVPGPSVLHANGMVAVTVGSAVVYDATLGGTAFSDPAGGGLTYMVALTAGANGLAANGGSVSGVPTQPHVTLATVSATDSRGLTVSDTFAIVAFAGDLPALPASLTAQTYSLSLPAHFTALVDGVTVAATDNTPAANPITDAGATLGRVLFYDPRLSANDGEPCSSCHIQSLGFGDTFAKSLGFDGGQTGRHSTGLSNARFYQRGRFFWDERAATLEDQVLGPIQDPVEMGMSIDNLIRKLRATSFYAPLFTAAFGTSEITPERISRALAQFVRAMVSGDSRYDRAFAGGGMPNFAATLTPQEQDGERLFRSAGCAACHTTVAQVLDSTHNTGLDAVVTDAGAGGGAFKVPSLRNVAVRPRYMHDGRFASLEEVVSFYNSGVAANPNLDARLRAPNGQPKRLGLTAPEQASLVAFLRTLTDSIFLNSAKFSNPFAPEPPVVTPTPGPSPAPSPSPTPTPSPLPTPTPEPTPAPAGTAITIQGNAYHPASVTVTPGTTITFTNLDNRRHGATFADAAITSTGIFNSGSRTVVMPTAPGTYRFQCPVHGAAMQGVVTVQ